MQVEWLVLADAAQVVGNKLYLLGGGWDRLTVHQHFPVLQHCAVAASVLVEWEETEKFHDFALEIFHLESGVCLNAIEAEFEMGRPPGLQPGRVQRWQFAGDFDLELEGPGRHVILARVNGVEQGRLEFEVVSGVRASDLPG